MMCIMMIYSILSKYTLVYKECILWVYKKATPGIDEAGMAFYGSVLTIIQQTEEEFLLKRGRQ